MNTSSESAEQLVRMYIQGVEVAAKLTGSGAKNLAVLLCAILKDKKMTKGKTTLTNMLKTNKELKVFSIRQEDLKKFTEESKRYGVLLAALIDRKHKSPDGLIDIMVKAEDAAKINRIVERFNLSTVDVASIKSEIQKTRNAKSKEMKASIEDQIVDDILSKPLNKEEHEQSNPSFAKTEKSPQSEHLSKNKSKLEEGTKKKDKPSVRKELNKIKEEMKKESNLEDSKDKTKNSKVVETKHQQPKTKKKKSKERVI
jgi:hypothetical protein